MLVGPLSAGTCLPHFSLKIFGFNDTEKDKYRRTQELTQFNSRSHPRNLVEKKDSTK